MSCPLYWLETTERLGKMARSFTAELVEGTRTAHSLVFYSHANTMIARWNAPLLLSARAYVAKGKQDLGI